ncbi:unnamed protein product, partial [Adineta steineri]
VLDIQRDEMKRWKIGEEKQEQGVIVAGENGEGNNLNPLHNLYGLTVDDDD